MRDVFSVLADKKAKIIWSVPKHCSKYLKLLDLPYLVLFLLFCVKKSDSVFYSIPENHLKIRLQKSLQLLKKYRIICFINDQNAFRYDGQNDGDPSEVRALAAADKILAPNVNTVSMLKKNGISSDMIPVGIWDYRMNETQIAKIREIRHAWLSPLHQMFHPASDLTHKYYFSCFSSTMPGYNNIPHRSKNIFINPFNTNCSNTPYNARVPIITSSL